MNTFRTCLTLPPNDLQASYETAIAESPKNAPETGKSGRKKRAVSNYKKLWRAGRTLKVFFLDPLETHKKNAFMKVFDQWTEHANLKFELVANNNAEIRIKTNTKEDFSYVGTDALLINKDKPTMFISALPGDEYFEAGLLHEIGHAIGFLHEHTHSEANIPWNKQKVYEYYKKFGWTKDEVDINLLTPSTDAIVDTEYDKTSIMHYEVPKALTDGVWEVGINTQLSDKDKYQASKTYPKIPGDTPWNHLLPITPE